MLATSSEIIDALGGNRQVSGLLDVGASAVSNYRNKGFPARLHYTLAALCRERGLVVDERIFSDGKENGKTARPAGQPANRPSKRMPELADSLQTPPIRMPDSTKSGRQTDSLLDNFIAAGFAPLSFPVIQPIAPFLGRLGEVMRRRLYSFTNMDGTELCLRPDLTIPTALHYLAHNGKGLARYCYQGLAFRYRSHEAASMPEEFTQLGIEIIGGQKETAEEEEFEILHLILQTLADAGVRRYRLRIFDHEAIDAIYKQAGISDRTRRRLLMMPQNEQTARKQAFAGIIQSLERRIAFAPPEGNGALNKNVQFNENDIFAGRKAADISARLAQKEKEAEQARHDIKILKELSARPDMIEQSAVYNRYHEKAQRMQKRLMEKITSLNEDMMEWNIAASGRLAYYTGLAFEVHVSELLRPIIASGGRYDDLLQSLGAVAPCPAIGGAISVERMQEAARL